jgi:hypothetical protein
MSTLAKLFSIALVLCATPLWAGAPLSGDYLESRTCDVYTGPCFANGESAMAGSEALMAWSIDQGQFDGVDLAGLKVAMAVKASDTLGYGGGLGAKPEPIRSIVMVDVRATEAQRAALVAFAKAKAGKVGGEVIRVDAQNFDFTVDHVTGAANLKIGQAAAIRTRGMRKGDCVCSNETIFYPPLTKVENSIPAYNLEHQFSAAGLGAKWSAPNSRSAFLATFGY